MSAEAQSMRVCRTCKNTLPRNSMYFYYRADSNSLRKDCRECTKRRNRKLKYKRDYGLEYEDYLAAKKAQGNQCLICSVEFNFQKIEATPHVDHCHTNGHVRGILCRNCNIGLGLFLDDPNRLAKAIEYLHNDIV